MPNYWWSKQTTKISISDKQKYRLDKARQFPKQANLKDVYNLIANLLDSIQFSQAYLFDTLDFYWGWGTSFQCTFSNVHFLPKEISLFFLQQHALQL